MKLVGIKFSHLALGTTMVERQMVIRSFYDIFIVRLVSRSKMKNILKYVSSKFDGRHFAPYHPAIKLRLGFDSLLRKTYKFNSVDF